MAFILSSLREIIVVLSDFTGQAFKGLDRSEAVRNIRSSRLTYA